MKEFLIEYFGVLSGLMIGVFILLFVFIVIFFKIFKGEFDKMKIMVADMKNDIESAQETVKKVHETFYVIRKTDVDVLLTRHKDNIFDTGRITNIKEKLEESNKILNLNLKKQEKFIKDNNIGPNTSIKILNSEIDQQDEYPFGKVNQENSIRRYREMLKDKNNIECVNEIIMKKEEAKINTKENEINVLYNKEMSIISGDPKNNNIINNVSSEEAKKHIESIKKPRDKNINENQEPVYIRNWYKSS